MTMLFRFFICVSLVMNISGAFQEQYAEAGVRRNHETPVILGEWQSPELAGGVGNFLPLEDGTPGKSLAVKIFVEAPEETVEVRFMIEAMSGPPYYLKTAVQDGGAEDLLLQEESVILLNVGTIPDYAVSRYIVEVSDDSGARPVSEVLKISTEPSGLLEHFGASVANQFDSLWNLPGTISSIIYEKERDLSRYTPTEFPPVFVITDNEGQTLNVLHPVETGDVASPVWLPEDRLLFVEKHGGKSTLKVVAAMSGDEPSRDLGLAKIEGDDPYFLPQSQAVVFRRESHLMMTELRGSEVLPLIQDKTVRNILGVFSESNTNSDCVVFVADLPDMSTTGLWLAKIRESRMISLTQIPYDTHWMLLEKVPSHGERILYERKDYISGRFIWNVYLSSSLTKEGKKISFDTHHDYSPAWSLDGTKIVYISKEIKD